jgi:hypothetical protein
MLNSCSALGDDTDMGRPLMGEMPSMPVPAGADKNGSSVSSGWSGLSEAKPCGEWRAAMVLKSSVLVRR